MTKQPPITRTDPYSRLYRIHDGTGKTIVIEGVELTNLTWDEVRKKKDLAVSRFKFKRAAIEPLEPSEERYVGTFRGGFAGEGNPSDGGGGGVVVRYPGASAFIDAQPNPDPQLEEIRQKAVAAARPAAQQAQHRHEELKAKQDPPRPPIVGLPPIDEALEGEDDEDGLGDDDVMDILSGGSKPTAEDVARAQAAAEADAAAADAAGKKLYERENPGQEFSPRVPWERLMESKRQEFRWRAINLPTGS